MILFSVTNKKRVSFYNAWYDDWKDHSPVPSGCSYYVASRGYHSAHSNTSSCVVGGPGTRGASAASARVLCRPGYNSPSRGLDVFQMCSVYTRKTPVYTTLRVTLVSVLIVSVLICIREVK